MKAEASIIESGAAGDLNLQKKAGALQLCGWQEGGDLSRNRKGRSAPKPSDGWKLLK